MVSVDIDVIPVIPEACEWISENNGWIFYKNNKQDILTEENNLTYQTMSSSLAVNFAILRGYKEIILAGIDLIEDGKPFYHYDGIMNQVNTEKYMCKQEKEFIISLCKAHKVKIYNINPKCDWLEYKDIKIGL